MASSAGTTHSNTTAMNKPARADEIMNWCLILVAFVFSVCARCLAHQIPNLFSLCYMRWLRLSQQAQQQVLAHLIAVRISLKRQVAASS